MFRPRALRNYSLFELVDDDVNTCLRVQAERRLFNFLFRRPLPSSEPIR